MIPLFVLWQCLWGFPQTLLGLCIFLRERRQPRFRYHGAVVTRWRSANSLSLGLFVFLSDCTPDEETARRWLIHEYGHSVQSILLGPAYLLVIGLPSVIWALFPPLSSCRRRRGISYTALCTESWADRLGERATGERLPKGHGFCE